MFILKNPLSEMQIKAASFWWRLYVQGFYPVSEDERHAPSSFVKRSRGRLHAMALEQLKNSGWEELFQRTCLKLLYGERFVHHQIFSIEAYPYGIAENSFFADVYDKMKSEFGIELSPHLFPVNTVRMNFADNNIIAINEQVYSAEYLLQDCFATAMIAILEMSGQLDVNKFKTTLANNHLSSLGIAACVLRSYEKLKETVTDKDELVEKLIKVKNTISSMGVPPQNTSIKLTSDDLNINGVNKHKEKKKIFRGFLPVIGGTPRIKSSESEDNLIHRASKQLR